MQILTTLAQAQTLAFGTPANGGFFGGLIVGAPKPEAIIWAPKARGEIAEISWHPDNVEVPGAMSFRDSMANTLAMAEAGSPLAKWALGLEINGYADWCVPARDVLELGYRNLKPTTWKTYEGWRDGENPSSLPPGLSYASGPEIVQTSAQAFQKGGEEAFEEAWYFASSQYRARFAWYQYFDSGSQNDYVKCAELRARAVRTIQLDF